MLTGSCAVNALGGIAGDETEKFYMLVKVFEVEFSLRVGIEIIKPMRAKSETMTYLGRSRSGRPVEVFERLFVRRVEIAAKGLVLGDQGAAPEEVYESALDRLLIEKRTAS